MATVLPSTALKNATLAAPPKFRVQTGSPQVSRKNCGEGLLAYHKIRQACRMLQARPELSFQNVRLPEFSPLVAVRSWSKKPELCTASRTCRAVQVSVFGKYDESVRWDHDIRGSFKSMQRWP